MYKKEYQKNKYICVDICVCVCLLCYKLYRVRYVCRRRVSRERLVMRGLNYVFRTAVAAVATYRIWLFCHLRSKTHNVAY